MKHLLPGMRRTRFIILFILVIGGLIVGVHHFGTDLQFNLLIIIVFSALTQIAGQFAIQADRLELFLEDEDKDEAP